MQHQMNLNAAPFEAIKNKTKTIEVRLYDEKRQQLKVGDEIIFTNRDDQATSQITTKVTALHIYPDFKSLYSDFDPADFGGQGWKVEELIENIRGFYSAADETSYGVVGIKLELLV